MCNKKDYSNIGGEGFVGFDGFDEEEQKLSIAHLEGQFQSSFFYWALFSW